jgi:alkanesulfonate monooxygenase SsuD/methylene tetrahydromethanopterin reductase-like flavin-dependent oxidoreductase (luciferase family)
MEEQIRACRALWTQAPASFQGKHVSFSRVLQKPFPLQAGGIPIWLGVSDSDRNLARVAELADGWCPPSNDAARLVTALAKLRELLADRGRDPHAVKIRVVLPTANGPSGPDLDASLAHIDEYARLGVDAVEITAATFCDGIQGLEGFLRSVRSARVRAPRGPLEG